MRSTLLRLSVFLAVMAIFPCPLTIALPLISPTAAEAQSDTVVRMQTQAARRATLITEVEIGSETAGPEYLFNWVGYVAPTKSGSILAVEIGGQDVAMPEYSSTGTYLRTWARRGDGPGEIRGPGGLAVHPDGSVFLWDATQGRMHVYTPDGKPLDTWALSGYSTRGGDSGFSIDANGLLYLPIAGLGGITRSIGGRSITIGGNPSTFGLLRLTRSGRILDTLWLELPSLQFDKRQSTEVEGRGRDRTQTMMRIDVPYLASVVWAMSPLAWRTCGWCLHRIVDRPIIIFDMQQRCLADWTWPLK